MRSVLENDKQTVEDGKLIQESIDRGLGEFTPDVMFEKLVQNYREAQELYGETILRQVTGYEPSSLERNIRLPEFKRLLKEQLTQRLKEMRERGVLDRSFGVTDQGFLLAALVLIKDELDHLLAVGYGKRAEREKRDVRSEDVTPLRRSYRDLDLRKTLALMGKRAHTVLGHEDLRFRERASEGKVSIVYCIDASGSMRGKKLALAKRAGVALAYKAVHNGDDVGLLAFGAGVETSLAPSKRFKDFVQALVMLRAKYETDIANAIRNATPMLKGKSKHVLLLTDALHTTSDRSEVLAAAQEARDQGVSVSIIGINLDKEGEELSEAVINVTRGQFYRVQNLEELDLLVLEDYARLKR